MTTSEFIAGLMGPLFITMGVALAVDRSFYQRAISELQHNSIVVFFAGAVLLVASLAIVRTHNIWEGWPTVVTILGWLGVVGGIARMLLAGQAAIFAESFGKSRPTVLAAAATMLLVGGFLTVKGYAIL